MEKRIQPAATADTMVDAPGSQPAPVNPGGDAPHEGGFAERYAAKDLLGEGGMGEVRLCHDRRIGRQVAMKVIRPEHGDRADVRQRFLREARVQGQLEHPAVVPVYDLGASPDGEVYFTMKRVRGASLEAVLAAVRQGRQEVAARYSRHRLLTAFQSVCLALDFAHQRGVLHRDLKPANIMLGDFGEVYLLDWGLARVSGTPDEASGGAVELGGAPVNQTMDGQILGTPGYMAPEQVRGDLNDLGPAADIYALGAILFEILTLLPLHPGERVEALIVSTLHGAEARPSVRAPEAEVPPELEEICVRATALEPGLRYASARALQEALERYLDGDRDLELRHGLARQHADEAKEAAARALSAEGDEHARAQALRDVGRALALDPRNADALRTLVQLLTEPPAHVPEGARAENVRATEATTRLAAFTSGIAYLGWMAMLPLVMWMGVRSWAQLALSWGAIGLTGVVYLLCARRPTVYLGIAVALLTAGGHGVGTRMFGPMFWVPGVVAMCMLAFAVQPVRSLRYLALGTGCLSFCVPLALEWAGLIAPSYSFAPGQLIIHARMLDLPREGTMIFLGITSVAIVVTPFLFLSNIRDALFSAQRRLQLQAWQLRQLVPDEAQAAAVPPQQSGWHQIRHRRGQKTLSRTPSR